MDGETFRKTIRLRKQPSWLADRLERWGRGDFVHPIIVKELRQELKARAFFVSFLFPPLFYSIGLLLLSGMGMRQALLVGYWTLMGLLLVLQPLGRAFASFYSEERARSLELLQLTGLGSFAIVLGKWSALLCQTALLTLVMLPFLGVHYFFFGSELVSDLGRLGMMCLGSVAITTVALTFSAANYGHGRRIPAALLVFIILFGGWSLLAALSNLVIAAGAVSSTPTIPDLLWLTLCGIAVVAQLLLFAASRIARSYEAFGNRSRLLGITVAAIGSIVSITGTVESQSLLAGLAAVLLLGGVLGLIDIPRWRELRFFKTRGRQFRECFRMDGWPGGSIYIVIFCLVAAPAVAALPLFTISQKVLIVLLPVASLLLPRALLAILFPSAAADVIRMAIAHLTLLGMGSSALWAGIYPLGILYPPLIPFSSEAPVGMVLAVAFSTILSIILLRVAWHIALDGKRRTATK